MGPLHLSSDCRRLSPPARPRPRGDSAFTLLEILVVCAIIAILASLILPTILNSQKAGRQVSSVNNLRQWGVAFAGSVGEHSGEMPTDGGSSGSVTDPDAWYNRMPPHIKLTPLKDAAGAMPKLGQKSLWINPGAPAASVPGVPFTYGFNDYLSTTAEPNMRITRVTYPAKTLLMAEKQPDVSPICNPGNIRSYYGAKDEFDPDATCSVLFVDGHAEAVKRKVFTKNTATAAGDEETLRAAEFLWIPYENAGL